MPETIVTMFSDAMQSGGAKPAYRYKLNDTWQTMTFAEASAQIERIGAGIMALGATSGSRIAILANSRLEWSLSDYAVLGSGAVVVPIYQTNGEQDCLHILSDSGAFAVILEDAAQLAKIQAIAADLPTLRYAIVIDSAGVHTHEASGDALRAEEPGLKVLSFDELRDHASDADVRRWHEAGEKVESDQLATLIYTSGTTGPPKGCKLSHRNYREMTEMIAGGMPDVFAKDDTIALFLPLAHTFARLIHFIATRVGIELAFLSIPTLMDELVEVKPTVLPSVPRIFEKAHTKIAAKFSEETGVKAKLIARALRVGRLHAKYLEAGRRVPPLLAAQFALYQKLVFSKVQARFGGRLRLCVSGGAPLSKEIQEFFLACGILVVEGYGLTESTTAITLNNPRHFRIGSVGQAIPGTEVKIADDGEIIARGPQVFQGYYGNDAATAEVITDGWLHTGDVGAIDDEGFVYITDRKKDILVTAGGKNVAPQNVENALKATQYISQAVVCGDRKPFISALITLDAEELASFAANNDISGTVAELVHTDAVLQLVRDAIDHVNASLSHVEQVKRARVLPFDFSEASGEMTPSLKVKRKIVLGRYGDIVENMYEANVPDLAAADTDPAIRDQHLSEPVA